MQQLHAEKLEAKTVSLEDMLGENTAEKSDIAECLTVTCTNDVVCGIITFRWWTMMKNIRKRIYDIVEVANEEDKISTFYDSFMLVVIILSLIPLAFKKTHAIFQMIEMVSVVIFIVDYLLRWVTADFKFKRCGVSSFIKYPVSFMAIVDLISILPSVTVMNAGFKTLRVLRLIKTLRIFRVFKAVRYSKNIKIIINVMEKSKEALLTVSTLAIGYVLISALVIINVEPDTFDNYFDALYWATISLTTMGYGDIYPVSTVGRIVTMVSSFIGIAIVALPAGIITAGYMTEVQGVEDEQNEKDNEKKG